MMTGLLEKEQPELNSLNTSGLHLDSPTLRGNLNG